MTGKRSLGPSPASKPHNLRNRPQKLNRKKVLKMLAVMEAQQAAGPSTGATAPPNPEAPGNSQDFLASGRTGRRNALPDILGEHALVTSSDLPAKLQALTTAETVQSGPKKDQGNSSNS